MTPADWPGVASIYRQGIDTGDATFEAAVPTWEAWDASHKPRCRLVAEAEGDVVGFAALNAVSQRAVYAGVAEVMIYVAEHARGRGVGRTLLSALIRCSEADGIWSLQAGVFPENKPSVAVHRAAGFRVLGTRERIGRGPDGRWRDVVILERRSRVVGGR